MHPHHLSRVTIHGFKSIYDCDLELSELNILIGPNGAGKSNFIDFFRLVQHISQHKLQLFIAKQGGPDTLLHFGRKKTENISADLTFGLDRYAFILEPTHDNRMMLAAEKLKEKKEEVDLGAGHFETKSDEYVDRSVSQATIQAIRSWRVFHFHDTGESALVKQLHGINDNMYLRQDGRNLAAFLFRLSREYPVHFRRIVQTIKLTAPFFGNFLLRPSPGNVDRIELEWTEKNEDIPFKGHHLSDGTLRFICLTTLLMQPEELQPETILIDEPELGLHPFAIRLLASMLRSASKQKQIIISTQSTDLLNEFEPSKIIVADRSKGKTFLHRLDEEALQSWLSEYSLGELWQKNILGGRPSR